MDRIHILGGRLSRLRRVFRQHGALKAVKLVFESLVMRLDAEWLRACRDGLFDRQYHVETGGFRTLEELGLGAECAKESHNYRGTPVALFKTAFYSLSTPWEDFEFVDYGSGMGKALLLASNYPFRRVTGVEFSSERHAIAERNMAGWRLPNSAVLRSALSWPTQLRGRSPKAAVCCISSIPFGSLCFEAFCTALSLKRLESRTILFTSFTFTRASPRCSVNFRN
jgi:hypothetical protein